MTNVKLVLLKYNARLSKINFYHILLRKYTNAVICVSKLLYQLQTQHLSNIGKRKLHIVHNGTDINKFKTLIAKEAETTNLLSATPVV